MSNDPRRAQGWAAASSSSASSGKPALYGPMNNAEMYLAMQNNGSQHKITHHQHDQHQLMQAAPTTKSFPPVTNPLPQHQTPRPSPPAALPIPQHQMPMQFPHVTHPLPLHQTQPHLQQQMRPQQLNLLPSDVQQFSARRQMQRQDDGEADRGLSNEIGRSVHGLSSSQRENTADPSMERQQSGHYLDACDEYAHLHSLISEQQALLDAHIAEVAYQQALVERQLAMENELTKEMYERLVRTKHTENAVMLGRYQDVKNERGQSDVLHEERLKTVQKLSAKHAVNNAGNVCVAQHNKTGGIESVKDYSVQRNSGPIRSKNDDTLNCSTHIPKLPKQQIGEEKTRAESGLPSDTVSDTSREGVKRKYQTALGDTKYEKKPAIPFPKRYTTFISDIHSDPKAETLICHFNKTIKPTKEEDLCLAVYEDEKHIQISSRINQQYYKEQLHRMDMRLNVYSRLDEEFDKMISQQSSKSASKNARSSFVHIREVTLDLIYIGVNNYQMLENNMDTMLGLLNS